MAQLSPSRLAAARPRLLVPHPPDITLPPDTPRRGLASALTMPLHVQRDEDDEVSALSEAIDPVPGSDPILADPSGDGLVSAQVTTAFRSDSVLDVPILEGLSAAWEKARGLLAGPLRSAAATAPRLLEKIGPVAALVAVVLAWKLFSSVAHIVSTAALLLALGALGARYVWG